MKSDWKNNLHSICITLTVLLLTLPGGQQTALAGGSDEVLVGVNSQEENAANSAPSQNAGSGQAADIPQMAENQTQLAADTTDEEEWCLILVNREHPIPADYVIPSLTQLSGGHQVDSRIYPALQQMFDDARAQGIYPAITSSYRTMEDQQYQMDSKISEYKAAGYSDADAKTLAEEWVAIPGTSEHQLGLCVDISADAASGQDPGSVWYWLLQNSYRYGFVKRYPEDKTEITGIINEPWHYRYVGVKAATEMTQQGLCLEEYLQQAPKN